MPVDVEVLHRLPFFATLSPQDLTQVAAMTMACHFHRGDIIELEGEPGGALYYVHSGLVKVFKTSPQGKEQALRLIAPGHTFNVVPALDGGPNPASAAAIEPSVIYVIRRIELNRLIMSRPRGSRSRSTDAGECVASPGRPGRRSLLAPCHSPRGKDPARSGGISSEGTPCLSLDTAGDGSSRRNGT